MSAAETLRMLLDPQTSSEDSHLDYILHELDDAKSLNTLDRLATMVHRAVTGALRDGAATGREECLHAVQAVIDEVAGGAKRREGGGE